MVTRELVRYTHFLKKVHQTDELSHFDKVESEVELTNCNVCSTQQQQQ
jgi:hypothetical protein